MTPTASTPRDGQVVCAGCGTPTHHKRGRWPWCERCGCYLVRDAVRGDWVSFAEREYRRRDIENARLIAFTAGQADTAIRAVRDRLPAGWTATVHQPIAQAPYTIAVTPPAGADITARLCPPCGDGGWRVRVHDRGAKVDFPLYTAGGARAATFTTAVEALDAAVRAVRVAVRAASTRR